jgi:hypothetical protein
LACLHSRDLSSRQWSSSEPARSYSRVAKGVESERWLGEAGHKIVLPGKDHRPDVVNAQLVIANISSPESAAATIDALRSVYSAPILALSARFRRGLGGSSEAAHRFYVGKVSPKPFTRDELLTAVSETIDRQ